MPHKCCHDGCHELYLPMDWIAYDTLHRLLHSRRLSRHHSMHYFLRRGYFEDIEEVKYQLFREEDNTERK